MEGILLLLYLIIITWMVSRTSFFLRSGLSRKFLIVYFLISTGIAIGHLWFAYNNFPGHGDMWTFFSEGVKLKNYLLQDYSLFLKEMQVDVYEQGIFTSGSFLVRIQYQFISFIYMLFNFLSFSNNYINLVLFGYLLMFGKIALYRVAKHLFPGNEIGNLGFLLLPGLIFWTGPIHKEGLIFLSIGLIAYCLTWFSLKKLPLLILSIFIIFMTRNYVLVLLGLALAFFVIFFMKKYKYKAALEVVVILLTLAFLIFPQLSQPVFEQIINRKQEFDSLKGNTRLPSIVLEPGFGSFARAIPIAFQNGFLLPYPGQFNGLYSIFSVEMYLIMVLLVAGFVYMRPQHSNPETQAGKTIPFLIFGITGILICGYIIPFAGALVRYRSIYLPFLWVVAIFQLQHFPILKSINKKLEQIIN